MPRSLYKLVLRLNRKWKILLTNRLKYREKAHSFYRSKFPISGASVPFLEKKAFKREKYELSISPNKENVSKQSSMNIDYYSQNISSFGEIRKTKDSNIALSGNKLITKVKDEDIKKLQEFKPKSTFYLPLKVPSEKDKFIHDKSNYTKSNLNACYGAPRSKGGHSRSWWEMQITVSKEITKQAGYPKRGEWFFVVTDDGYKFKAHAVGDNGKQFAAVGDEQLLGRWIKGRLVSLGIVTPIENTSSDIEKKGMITKEMLHKYGGEGLVLTDTGEEELDKEGVSRKIWLLSFPRKTF